MTLLSSINAACDMLALDQFDTIIGNDQAAAMLQFAQQAGDEIAARADWNRMLVSEPAATSPYTIPADFRRLVPGGVRTSVGDYVRPVTSNGDWALVKRIPSTQAYYFIADGAMAFSPSSGTFIVEYVSTTWLQSGQAAPTDDTDAPLFPETLWTQGIVWRWKRQKGLPFDDQLAEFEASLARESKGDRGGMT